MDKITRLSFQVHDRALTHSRTSSSNVSVLSNHMRNRLFLLMQIGFQDCSPWRYLALQCCKCRFNACKRPRRHQGRRRRGCTSISRTCLTVTRLITYALMACCYILTLRGLSRACDLWQALWKLLGSGAALRNLKGLQRLLAEKYRLAIKFCLIWAYK